LCTPKNGEAGAGSKKTVEKQIRPLMISPLVGKDALEGVKQKKKGAKDSS